MQKNEKMNHNDEKEKKKKRQNPQRKNFKEESIDFELEEDGGDQGVKMGKYENPYAESNLKDERKSEEKIYSKIKTENMDDYMSENEMKELLSK